MKNNEFSYFQNEIQLCTNTFFTAASSQFWILLFRTRLLRVWNLKFDYSHSVCVLLQIWLLQISISFKIKKSTQNIHYQWNKRLPYKEWLLLSKVCQINNIFRDLMKNLMKKFIRKKYIEDGDYVEK